MGTDGRSSHGVVSVITAGILPAVFFGMARSRRKRLEPFVACGLPATARVLDIAPEDVAFDVKLARVKYEFEADGRMFRDADQVLTSIADRWDRGTLIQILYRPDQDYDSVIATTS